MFKINFTWLLCAALMLAPDASAQDEAPLAPAELIPVASARIITLEAAVSRALASSPQLKAAHAAADASKGAQNQAGALPNPELGIEADNIAGQGEYSGLKSAEITYGVSQLVEIGGKLSARQASADHQHSMAHAEYETTRLDLIRDVKTAYAEAVAAKEGVALAEKQKALAGEVLNNVAKRVSAAAVPLFQKSKSEVAFSTSAMALDRAQREFVIARKRLAAYWDAATSDFDLDTSRFFEIVEPSQLVISEERVRANPDVVRWDAEVARNEAQYELEQANMLPDPRLNAGLKEFRASKERAFVVGVSIPIPVFNLNQGNVAKARGDLTKAASSKHLAEITLNTELTRSQQELESAYRQAQILKNQILPSAEKAFSLSRQGYDAGKFAYLEVLDAQRTLVEARAQYNDTLKTYHIKRAEVERLTATYTPAPDEKDDAHAD
jgi:cobalt-zinc-cadmium efflux system outer membrane protein